MKNLFLIFGLLLFLSCNTQNTTASTKADDRGYLVKVGDKVPDISTKTLLLLGLIEMSH